MIYQEARGVDFTKHVGEIPLNSLKLDDPLVKSLSVTQMGEGILICRTGDADAHCARQCAGIVQHSGGLLHALAFLADHVICRHAHVIESDVHVRPVT